MIWKGYVGLAVLLAAATSIQAQEANPFAARQTLPFAQAVELNPVQNKPKEPARATGYTRLAGEKRKELFEHAKRMHGNRLAVKGKFQALPASFDCRDKGWVLPVGDQGNCGSCYLYSTVYGTLSQAFVKAGYGKNDGSFVMSVQFGMDCHNFGGCNGGNGTEVIDWVCKNGWPAERWIDIDGKAHNDYPAYEGRSRSCRLPSGAKLWKPATWGFATGDQSDRQPTTAEIKTAMFNYGALNVSLDAGGQFGNGAGTITALGTQINHEIEMIAWDDNKDGGSFLLKNQWTTDWGNGGVRWVTYKAAAHIVDIFWVSVTAQPPPTPPVPPTPPGPVPPTPGVKTLIGIAAKYSDGSTETVKVVPSDAIVIHQSMTLKELFEAMGKAANSPVTPTPQEPPMITPSLSDRERLDRIERLMERLEKKIGL